MDDLQYTDEQHHAIMKLCPNYSPYHQCGVVLDKSYLNIIEGYQSRIMSYNEKLTLMIQALEFVIPYHSLACFETGDDGNYLFLNNGEVKPIVSYDSCQCKNKEHRKLLPFGSRKGFNA